MERRQLLYFIVYKKNVYLHIWKFRLCLFSLSILLGAFKMGFRTVCFNPARKKNNNNNNYTIYTGAYIVGVFILRHS